MGIVGIVAKQSGADLSETAYAYAKTAIALFDAFIQCWNIKYIYNTIKPQTVINKYFDANWKPHLQAPPFCRKITPAFKAKIALEAVKNQQTFAESAEKFEVNPIMISRWKAELPANMGLF